LAAKEKTIATGHCDFVSIFAEKKQQYRQNRVAPVIFTRGSHPWLQKFHPSGVFCINKILKYSST